MNNEYYSKQAIELILHKHPELKQEIQEECIVFTYESKKNKEYIICSAIYINDEQVYEMQPTNIEKGFVVCGRRHGDCYNTIKCIVGLDEAVKIKVMNAINMGSLEEHRKRQGFLTSTNRYVDRKEAYEIAKENNQLLIVLDEGSELISENLY